MRRSRTSIAVLALAFLGVGALTLTPLSPASAAAGSWSAVPVPNPSTQFTYLQSIDGRTDSDAWAVGYVSPPTASPNTPLALHWNGSAWSNVSMPQQGIGTTLWGVSASGSADAWAVGSFFTHPPGYSVTTNSAALHWNGGAWSAVSVPGSSTLFGVADLSPSNAYAVGYGVQHWDGSAWSTVATPSPNPSGVGPGSLYAISARTPSDIWAVGLFSPRRHVTASFGLHFNGTAWSLVPMPGGTQLWSVVAVGPNDAWAAGQLGTGSVQPVTEHWDGVAWSIVSTPTVAAGAYLRGISARAANDVWAVGPAFTGEAGVVQALTLHWNGSTWTVVPAPTAGSPDLWSVSARPGTTHTWASGDQSPGVALILERH